MRIQYVEEAGSAGTFFYAQTDRRVVGTIHQNGGKWHAKPFRKPALAPADTLARAKVALRRAIRESGA